jgi:hypothetical protein
MQRAASRRLAAHSFSETVARTAKVHPGTTLAGRDAGIRHSTTRCPPRRRFVHTLEKPETNAERIVPRAGPRPRPAQ